MVLPNVTCEWRGGVKITYGVVASDVCGFLLLGPFPVYTNKEEMHKWGCLLWGFILPERSSMTAQSLGVFFSPPKEHLEFELRCFFPWTTLSVPTRL